VIGRQLAALRHASGLTQEQLAERAQVSVDVIRRLEQGQRQTARFTTLQAIATALDTEVSISFAVRDSGSPDSGHDQNGSSPGRDSGSSEMKRRELLHLVTSATAVIGLGGSVGPDFDRLAASTSSRLGRADLAEFAALNAGSGVVLRKLRNLRPELAQFKKDPHVRNLDTEIAHLVVSSH